MDWEKKYSSAGMKLEIGSGEYPRQIENGFYHSDVRYPMPHQEICFSLLDLPFKDNSWDAIAIMHTLEHVSWMKVQDVLKELYRVLKPNGLLSIVSPNLIWNCNHILTMEKEGITDAGLLETVMGQIYSIHNFPENNHLVGFFPRYLMYLLKQAGFDYVEMPRNYNDSNVEAWAVKCG
ncbi:MAG: methyltransferase domain-containing protein [Gammaproteobacteria bacterium]|nr:methyltransferase domain-containing protein [Gammaproteobacteria bacterium]